MKRGRFITIGSFDGVHRGHLVLLDQTRREAKKRKLKSMALTFFKPPKMILQKESNSRILSDSFEKIELIGSRGIDEIEFLPFNSFFSKMRPFEFFRTLLNQYKAKGIIIGSDFRFGKNRAAGAVDLVRWGLEFEIPIWVISPVRWNREIVSSTRIRELLIQGRYQKAKNFLGHPYSIFGKTIKGKGKGHKLGFPTANIGVIPHKICPFGVFAVEGWIGRLTPKGANYIKESPFQGVANMGVRPTFENNAKMSVEVHLFNHKRNLLGKYLFFYLRQRLRSEKKFSSIKALQRSIGQDIRRAECYFNKNDTRIQYEIGNQECFT